MGCDRTTIGKLGVIWLGLPYPQMPREGRNAKRKRILVMRGNAAIVPTCTAAALRKATDGWRWGKCDQSAARGVLCHDHREQLLKESRIRGRAEQERRRGRGPGIDPIDEFIATVIVPRDPLRNGQAMRLRNRTS